MVGYSLSCVRARGPTILFLGITHLTPVTTGKGKSNGKSTSKVHRKQHSQGSIWECGSQALCRLQGRRI